MKTKKLIFHFLSGILIMVVILNINVSIQAETDVNSQRSEKRIILEPIVVTPRRTLLSMNELTDNVIIITKEEIEMLPARDISEVLRYIPGVDIQPRQGFGRATSISIHGCDSRHVRVMIDGIPLNSQASGQFDPAKIPVENVSKIEIIKGPSSTLWGSSLGGVVNIITKDTGESRIPEINITTSFAEFNTPKESVDISGKAGIFGYYLFSSHMKSEGSGPKDNVFEKKYFCKFSLNLKDMGTIVSSLGYTDSDTKSGIFPDLSFEEQPYINTYGKLSWNGSIKDSVTNIDFKFSRQRIFTKTFSSLSAESPLWTIRTKDLLYQLSLHTTLFPRDKDVFVFGADFDWDTIESTYLTESKNVQIFAPYTNYTLQLKPWNFNGGIRYDNNSEFGEEPSYSGGVVYHLDSTFETTVRGTISTAFNAPPLLWKYYEETLSWITTNPDIKAEYAVVYHIGVESNPFHKFKCKCSGYQSHVSDAIALAVNDEGKLFMKNFEKFKRQGIEFYSEIPIIKRVSLTGGASFNEVIDKTTGEKVKGGGKPKETYDAGINYKDIYGFNLLLKAYYNDWNEPAINQSNDKKFLFDLKLTKEFNNISIFLNILNLANSSYCADNFFPVKRRYFEGGITLKL